MELPINKILQGDCLEEMKKLSDNSVDAIITDPPYGLGFMGKEWDIMDSSQFGIAGNEGENDLKVKKNFKILPRIAEGGALQKFSNEWAKECLRVLKPGGYLLSFGGTRTYHRMTCGIEDAGFEIRDCIMWVYGSGFPKSLNIGKQIDKIQGNKRESLGIKQHAKKDFKDNLYAQDPANANNEKVFGYGEEEITKGNSEWEGWGTALKPACEPIVVARKPLSEKNVALNVLKWGTGGINIDESRIDFVSKEDEQESKGKNQHSKYPKSIMRNPAPHGIYHPDKRPPEDYTAQGRFPANIILDEESAKMLDEQSGNVLGSHNQKFEGNAQSIFGVSGNQIGFNIGFNDSGGASRFFYVAKASKSERNLGCEELEEKQLRKEDNSAKSLEIFSNQYTENSENPTGRGKTPLHRNNHPTVKPIKLMEYLIKLVSREGAIILDPFIGSGTTAIACLKLGRKFIGIEKEEEYVRISNARIKPYLSQTKIIEFQ